MNEKEKTTVPIPSVGADGEQSLSYVTNEIIATGNEEINPIDESMEEMLRRQIIPDGADRLSCQHRTSTLELSCPCGYGLIPCLGG